MPAGETFGKLDKLVSEGDLFIMAQIVFEQTRNNLAKADADAAEEHQEFAVLLVHWFRYPSHRDWDGRTSDGS